MPCDLSHLAGLPQYIVILNCSFILKCEALNCWLKVVKRERRKMLTCGLPHWVTGGNHSVTKRPSINTCKHFLLGKSIFPEKSLPISSHVILTSLPVFWD
jgi:hypothetical protein